MRTSYKTIASVSEGIYREKGSKFIARASRVNNEEDCIKFLSSCKKEFHDARHHCYAYVLGPNSDLWKVNDDGEPNHSAGDPILGQIRSSELTNTMVVVIRYFGGTKLGVPGLINAYRSAAADALEAAKPVTVELREEFKIQYPYDSTNLVMQLIGNVGARIVHQDFSENCFLEFSVLVSEKERTAGLLSELEQQSKLLVLAPEDPPS